MGHENLQSAWKSSEWAKYLRCTEVCLLRDPTTECWNGVCKQLEVCYLVVGGWEEMSTIVWTQKLSRAGADRPGPDQAHSHEALLSQTWRGLDQPPGLAAELLAQASENATSVEL